MPDVLAPAKREPTPEQVAQSVKYQEREARKAARRAACAQKPK